MARGSESRGLHVTCMDPPAELREEQGSEGKQRQSVGCQEESFTALAFVCQQDL